MSGEDVQTQDQQTLPAPGWKTSEFYITVASKVFAILVTLGVVTSSDADAYTKGISGIVAGIFVIASTYLAAHYTTRRTQVKSGAGLSIFLLLLFCLPAGAADVRDCTVRISVPGRGGSAVVIGCNGNQYLLSSAAHVVTGHKTATVIFADHRKTTATVNHCDNRADLALLTLTSQEKLPCCCLGDDPQKGDPIWQVGYPAMQGKQVLSPTAGYARGVNGGSFYGDLIIKSGDSGGGFFDSRGRLVGVSCASINDTIATGPSASTIRQACNGIGVGGWMGICGPGGCYGGRGGEVTKPPAPSLPPIQPPIQPPPPSVSPELSASLAQVQASLAGLQASVQAMQNQPKLPGPVGATGLPGPAGPQGPPGKDADPGRVSVLESRISALERQPGQATQPLRVRVEPVK